MFSSASIGLKLTPDLGALSKALHPTLHKTYISLTRTLQSVRLNLNAFADNYQPINELLINKVSEKDSSAN